MELDQDFSAGEAYEAAVQSLVDRGFAVARAVAAMRKAQGDREIALGLLERGETLEEDKEDEETQEEGNPLAFLLSNDDFLAAKSQLQAQPSLIPVFMTRLQTENPELFALIDALPEAFQQLLRS